MNLRNSLNRLVRVVADEAERNPAFKAALHEAISAQPAKPTEASTNKEIKTPKTAKAIAGEQRRGKNRRAAAVLDPVHVVRSGETVLRVELATLNIEQLKDIIAEYGMDPGRLVTKWNTPERVIDRIVELSLARAHKGDAFRRPIADASAPSAHDRKDDAN